MYWSIPRGQGGANLPVPAGWLQKLGEEEGEMERRTAWHHGCCSLPALGNKLKVRSLFVPWSPKLAFHTSLVPAARCSESGGKNLPWGATLGCATKHATSLQLMRWQVRLFWAETTCILLSVWIALLCNCSAADGSYS